MALEASYYSIRPEKRNNWKELNLSRQSLLSLPEGLKERIERDKFTDLDLSRNNLSLTSLPQLSFSLTLRKIDFSRNQFAELPLEVCQLSSLRVLLLKCNRIKSLPQEIGSLEQLEELNLSGNAFEQFPTPLLSLSCLSFLHLGANRLQQVPAGINRLKELTYLYLGGNRLQHVPAELGQLSKLEALVLSSNQLQFLPPQFKGLTSLKSLHLHDNQLQTLPQNIVRLKNLQELSLRNNPLVLRFIREYSGAIPSLLELSGQAVKQYSIPYSSEIIPETLCDFLSRARKCDNLSCSGVYFTLRNRRVTFVDFCGRYRVPLMQYLCSEQCQGGDDIFNYSSSSEDEGEEYVSEERIKRVLLG